MELHIDGRTVELTEQQLSAFNELTKLQQGVALHTLAGKKPLEAHRLAGGKAKNENARYASVSEILSRPSVDAFIKSFNAERIASTIMGREEMMERLTIMARAKITDVVTFHNRPVMDLENGNEVLSSTWAVKDPNDVTNDALVAVTEVTAGKDGIKLKMHDQIAAMKQLAAMQGFDAPKKVEVSGELATRQTLSDFYATDIKPKP